MPRPLRIVFACTTGLSLLLTAGVFFFWVRSYVRQDFFSIGQRADGREQAIRSAHGRIYVGPVYHDAKRDKRFLRKSDSRFVYHFGVMALVALPALAHGMGVLIARESRRRAAMPPPGEREVEII